MHQKKLKIVFNAPVTLAFVLVCFFVTLAGALTGGQSTEMFFMTYRSSLTDPATYLRLFTHVFGHLGWEHFMGNTVYILLLGPLLEERYGSVALIEVIAITALVTGLVNFIFFPGIAMCGASGVVFAFILLSSFTGFRDREIPLTFILVTVIFLGQQVYDGLFVQDNISNMAHIVGGLVGTVIGYNLNKRRG